MPEAKKEMEVRSYPDGSKLELREKEDGETRTIGGYAVRYNTPTLMRDRWGGEWLEEISADCFKTSLEEVRNGSKNIKALWNHDNGKPIGSTRSGTLRIDEKDTVGLRYDVDLPNNSWGEDAYESVKRGDVDGSSFAFVARKDVWSKVERDGKQIMKRSITEAELLEVSPCTFPAYDSSEISCRGLEEAQKEMEQENKLQEAQLFYASLMLEEEEQENEQ